MTRKLAGMVIIVSLLLLPVLLWSAWRGNREDAELALGASAWVAMGVVGLAVALAW